MKPAIWLLLWVAVSPALGHSQEQSPYDFKGDRLGMSLAEFKAKYHRKVPNQISRKEWERINRPARRAGLLVPYEEYHVYPHCSDEHTKDKLLLADPEELAVGLVNCMIPSKTTIANRPTQFHLFKFVDQGLYEIMLVIDHLDYLTVREALSSKYGEPHSKSTKEYQNAFGARFQGEVLIWDNEVSAIQLLERSTDLNTSMVLFSHKPLSKLAQSRKHPLKSDDL